MAVQVNVSADQKKLVDSINKGVNAYNRRFASSNSINLKINERSFTQPLGRISGAVDDFGAAMAASNARVIAFGASTAVLGSAVAGFRSLARASIEVEKNLADVNRILQLTTSDLQMFGKELFNISKRTATSFNDASKALLEFSRQGLDASETLKRTNDALTLTRLAGLGAEASVAALTATVNGFSKSGITTTQVLNKLVAVEQSFAVSARDLSQGLARTGQAAQEAGVDIDQLNALISAAQQKTARGGAVIGNALKTIFTRLQRSDTLDRLEEFNVAVRDVQGNTLPAALILQNFAASYDKLADAQRAQLSEQVAGVYQVNILKAIISDLNSEQSIYNGALAKGSQATNEAARANAQLNQTLSALLVQTGNNAQQLASTIGSVTFEPLAKSAAKAANSILETFTGLLTGEGLASDFANGLLKGIRNVLGGPGAVAAFYTLFKLVQNSFTYVAQALPQLAGITTETQKRQSLEQAILGILQQENAVSKALVGTTGNQKRQAEILLGVAKQQTAEYQKQKTIASGLAATLRTQGVSVGSRGLQTGKTRSGGFIPNTTKQAERSGALAGGYMPGKVINSPVGGVMNTAEQVKYVPGFAQPFINPPKTSRAGRLHRVESLRQTGVNPYMHEGFVPNFAKMNHFQRGRDFEKAVGNLIQIPAKHNAPIDYEKVESDALAGLSSNLMFNKTVYGERTYADAHVGLGHTAAQIISKIINHEKGSLNLRKKPNGPFSVKNNLVEIIGKGADKTVTKKSAYESLNITAQKNLAENKKFVRSPKLLKGSKFHATFEKDKVNIPNFAAAYRNAYTGKLNNSAIARGLKSGDLSASEAAAMGYTTSGSKIDARKAKRASFVNSLNYKQVYVPWDIEAFRAKGSAAKGQTFNQTQGSTYEKYILNSLRSGIKGTTSLGAPFALPARPDAINGNLLKGKINSRIDGYSLSAGEMYEMKSGDKGDTLAGLQNKFIEGLKNNPEILNPKRKWKNYIFRTTRAKGRGASNGFIPNLAYKGEVMDLEESISGEKAIYSNTPFPHVRNASQPTFASAIADHGGLSNALKDSYGNQSAAGMVYGGFVPNFAPKDTITAQAAGIGDLSQSGSQLQKTFYKLQGAMRKLKVTIDLTDKQRNKLRQDMRTYARSIDAATGSTKSLDLVNDALAKSKKKNKTAVDRNTSSIKKNTSSTKKNTSSNNTGTNQNNDRNRFSAVGLAFAGPMAAGLLEQAYFGDRQRSDLSGRERVGQSVLSTGLTSISTGIAIGDSLNIPFGGLLGGIAGAGLGVVSAFNAVELSAEELTQANQKLADRERKNIDATGAFISGRSSLNSLVSSGATDDQVQKATRDLAKNFAKIEDVDLQESFRSAGANVHEMTKALDTYTQRISVIQAARNLGSFSDFGSGSNRAVSKLGSQRLTQELVAGINVNDFALNLRAAEIDIEKFEKLAREGFKESSQFVNQFSKGGAYQSLGAAAEDERLAREKFSVQNRQQIESLLTPTLERGTDQFQKAYDQIVNALFSRLGYQAVQRIKEIEIDEKSIQASLNAQIFATETFNSIFRGINKTLDLAAVETEKTINEQQSNLRLEGLILDFTSSFNEEMLSFVGNNLPPLEKLKFAETSAKNKTEAALAKLEFDYEKSQVGFVNERNKLLQNNTKELTKTFEENLFKSQEAGTAFRQNALPLLQQGRYSESVDLISSMGREQRDKRISQFNEIATGQLGRSLNLTALGGGAKTADEVSGTFNMFERAIQKRIEVINSGEANTAGSTGNLTIELEELSETLDELRKSSKGVIEAEKAISRERLETVLNLKQTELEKFDNNQELARKELEVSNYIAQQKIKIQETIATRQARIDAESLARTKAAEIASARLGIAGNIDQARRAGEISLAQNALDDPRANFGLGLKQITERRIKAEQDILEKRRAAQDAQLDVEMNQALMSLQAEIKNTRALEKLNETVLRLLRVQLGEDADVQAIMRDVDSTSDYETVRRNHGAEAANKFFALRGVESSLSQTGTRSSALEKALAIQKESGEINREELRIAAAKDGFSKLDLQMLEEIMQGKRDVLDIERGIENQILKNNNARAREGVDLAGNFKAGVGAMSSEADTILNNLARNAPSRFADGMANALNEVANGTKDIGDAFSDMAIDFGRMLQQEVFRALAQKAVGNLLSGFTTGQTGGSMSQGAIKAQNGMYISGGRTGDRNLALLEDGEYVLNRNAVRGMGGSKALDKLNFGMAPRFQSGGYNMYADQALKNNEYDFTGDLMFNGSNAGDVNPDLYSAYAFENSPYFQRQKEIANEKLQRKIRKRFEKQQKKAQLVGAIINMIGSVAAAGASSSISNASNTGAAARSAGSNLQSTTEAGNAALADAAQGSDYSLGRYIQRNSSTLTLDGQTLNQLGTNRVMSNLATNPNFIDEADFAKQYSSDSFKRQMADPFGGGMFNKVTTSSVFNDAGFTSQASNKPGLLKTMFSGARGFFSKGKRQEGGLINYNSGGFVPHGSRLSDTIPAMLTGGEYVMNNKAVAKYGLGTMNAMNAGGLSTSSTTNNSTNNNATSISVSVDRSGKSEYGAQTTSYNKDDIVISKEMAQQINALVLKRVVDEKRYGGELYKNPLRT